MTDTTNASAAESLDADITPTSRARGRNNRSPVGSTDLDHTGFADESHLDDDPVAAHDSDSDDSDEPEDVEDTDDDDSDEEEDEDEDDDEEDSEDDEDDEEESDDEEDDEDDEEESEEDDDSVVAVAGERSVSERSARGRSDDTEPSESELFRESEIAADYIEGLLDVLDYDGDIDELVQNGRPMVEVVGGRLQALVGSRGSTLEALQELSRLAVYRQTGAPSRLLLDVGGFRAGRRKELAAVAKNAAEKVKQHGEAVRLEPMSAFERKCVHDVINAMAGVESESEGVEPGRRIIVRPTA